MLKQVYVTTSVYALAHQLGMQEAVDEVARQLKLAQDPGLAEPDKKDERSKLLPAVKTIARLARFVEVGLNVDGGATYIGMARSRHFHSALHSGLPWITIDDDVEVSTSTVGAMLEALDDLKPRIIVTPYALRAPGQQNGLACVMPNVRVERFIGEGIKLLALEHGTGGGMGFVGMNRPAMQLIADACPPELAWVDSDGVQKRALFYERVDDMLWFGEDMSFFRWRVPKEVSVELLVTGHIAHAGVALDLGIL